MEVFLIENNTFAINLTNITHRSNDGNGHFVFKSSDNSFSITLSEEVMQVILFVAVKIGFICCICYCLSKNRRFTRCRRRLVTTLCGEETPAPSGDLNSDTFGFTPTTSTRPESVPLRNRPSQTASYQRQNQHAPEHTDLPQSVSGQEESRPRRSDSLTLSISDDLSLGDSSEPPPGLATSPAVNREQMLNWLLNPADPGASRLPTLEPRGGRTTTVPVPASGGSGTVTPMSRPIPNSNILRLTNVTLPSREQFDAPPTYDEVVAVQGHVVDDTRTTPRSLPDYNEAISHMGASVQEDMPSDNDASLPPPTYEEALDLISPP